MYREFSYIMLRIHIIYYIVFLYDIISIFFILQKDCSNMYCIKSQGWESWLWDKIVYKTNV